MTYPTEYQRASLEFDKFMMDARDISGLMTTNQAYTMVQGVFQTFRRRLSLAQAIEFANILPPVLRALFMEDWKTNEPVQEFGTRTQMTLEVQSLRKEHNFAPDTAIRDVAEAVRRNVDQAHLDRVLSELPRGARDFLATKDREGEVS
ncbi:MAG: hypothetical protein NTAFB01_00970 [Nitrospira sp.]